ncbi:serine hydrolase domain-containing protein [Cyclobacterium salsum]|uniref:serine hydrolase domain-containing protein n=1 Tax=Cyclobacterium salsum TaxID=2666329 RepID=UPI001390DD1A|nr:serine hydrolase domain-containing protein [Cyclobacterium salsum]
MKRIMLPIILLFIIVIQGKAQDQKNPIHLSAGESLLDSIPGSGSKRYFEKFTSGEFVFGQLDEHKGNFMISIYSPEDAVIAVFNSSSEGTENFSFNTTTTGNYIFEIKNLRSTAQQFLLKPIEKAPAAENMEGRIDQIMHFYPDDGPGAVVGVTKNGKFIFSKGYGMANLEYDIPNTPNTVFYLASVSKQFTSFAAALLMNEGKLSLDDPVKKYIPELKYNEVITIRDLIYHTNGLPGVISLFKIKNGENKILFTHQMGVDIITSLSLLNNPPREKFAYSNAGYVLLAMVIERITEQPLNLYMEEKVFNPLNMDNTFVGVDHEKIIKNRADHYWPLPNGGLRKIIAPTTLYGPTGFYSTVEDLAKWLDNFKNPKVGNENVIKQMYELGYLQNENIIEEYAFGLDVLNFRENTLIGHGGNYDSYHTYIGYLPDLELGIVILSNWYKATPCDAVLKILDHWVPDNKEGHRQKDRINTDFSSFEGSYITEDDFQVQVYYINGELYAQMFGSGPVNKLKHVSGLEFIGITPWCADYKINFTKEKKDNNIEGEFDLYGPSSFRRISFSSSWKPEKTELKVYEGEYYSEDLNTRFTITVDENQLIASNENHEKIILTPKDKDLFSGSQWYFENIRFNRSDEGNIDAMLVSGFRIKNIPFKKE